MLRLVPMIQDSLYHQTKNLICENKLVFFFGAEINLLLFDVTEMLRAAYIQDPEKSLGIMRVTSSQSIHSPSKVLKICEA